MRPIARRPIFRILLVSAWGLALVGAAPAVMAQGWTSGVRYNNDVNSFAAWRGSLVGIVSGYIDWKNGWSGMNKYASGSQPRSLHVKSWNVSFGHGLFPQGGDLAACARGDYDAAQAEVARRLQVNGVGDAEIRLGWEASGDWFPWTAAGKPADQWKTCFTRVADAMKGAAGGLRIGWYMAKKGRINVATIYPDTAPITYIGISHYDDAQARFGDETYLGGPWGLRAFLRFAHDRGKQLAIGEWGVGRVGDDPAYIQKMHDFFVAAGGDLAYEAYFNSGESQLYPSGPNPNSALMYQQLF